MEVVGTELSCGLREIVEHVKRWLGLMTLCAGFLEVHTLNWCVKDRFFLSEQITFEDFVYLQFD